MRNVAYTGLAALLFVSTASIASATSLNGKPFAIDPEIVDKRFFVSAFPKADGFAVSIADDMDDDGGTESLFFKSFTAKGKVDVKKSLVATATPAQSGPAYVNGAGGFELSDARALVGFYDRGALDNGSAVGGLFGQVMKGRKQSGKVRTLDNARKADTNTNGFIWPLADGRGVAIWTAYASNGATASNGRFVLPSGEIGPVDIKLSGKNRRLSKVSPLGDGFLTLRRDGEIDASSFRIFAQIYDTEGKETGSEGLLATDANSAGLAATTALGLSNGNILVLTMNGSNLVGQLYDDSWKKRGKERTFIENDINASNYQAVPLLGGGVLIATPVYKGNSGRIEFRRFGNNLKLAGSVARTKSFDNLSFDQLLALKTGNVVAIYSDNGRNVKAQIVKP